MAIPHKMSHCVWLAGYETKLINGKPWFRTTRLEFDAYPTQPTSLRAVFQQLVTRDGTDCSSVERRIENVLRQLEEQTGSWRRQSAVSEQDLVAASMSNKQAA